ncbi:hypothetical protein, partial [Enterococcus faecium]|uniref:hypothetical protein n=1 Tax=Enterococcus faecium TaxID=1352 RepID=UPI001C5B59A1
IIGNPSLNHRYRKGFYSLFKTLQQNPFFGFFNHVTRKINPLYFTQIKEELSNYRLKVVT